MWLEKDSEVVAMREVSCLYSHLMFLTIIQKGQSPPAHFVFALTLDIVPSLTELALLLDFIKEKIVCWGREMES